MPGKDWSLGCRIGVSFKKALPAGSPGGPEPSAETPVSQAPLPVKGIPLADSKDTAKPKPQLQSPLTAHRRKSECSKASEPGPIWPLPTFPCHSSSALAPTHTCPYISATTQGAQGDLHPKWSRADKHSLQFFKPCDKAVPESLQLAPPSLTAVRSWYLSQQVTLSTLPWLGPSRLLAPGCEPCLLLTGSLTGLCTQQGLN